VKITIEGQVYEFDPAQVRNRALVDVERETGMMGDEWQVALTRGSMVALTALVWLTLRQNGQPDLKFDEVDFDPKTLDVDDTDEEPGKDPEPEAPSPTN
jgi:hypothetical protein